MKIAVIGAGWVGMPLVNTLAKHHDVWATTSSPSKVEEIKRAGGNPILLEHPSNVASLPQGAVDRVVLTLPPSAYLGDNKLPHADLTLWLNRWAGHIIYCSSTSVYPKQNGLYKEEDAQAIVSPHSGVAILDVEEWNAANWKVPHTTLRFGGLAGGDRQPWKRSFDSWRNNSDSINYVHRVDAMRAVEAFVSNSKVGTYNVACPDAVTKAEVWNKVNGIDTQAEELPKRKVSSKRLMDEQGFSFTYPSVLSFPELL